MLFVNVSLFLSFVQDHNIYDFWSKMIYHQFSCVISFHIWKNTNQRDSRGMRWNYLILSILSTVLPAYWWLWYVEFLLLPFSRVFVVRICIGHLCITLTEYQMYFLTLMGDNVVHIELHSWADTMDIAPLLFTLGKLIFDKFGNFFAA